MDAPARSDRPQGAPARILVVDDSRVVRAVLCSALRNGGYQVDEADSGVGALEILAGGGHEAVITDLRMPGVDGFQLLAEVKRRDPDVEVIVLTGSHATDVTSAVRALRLGAHDYLAKRPSCPDEVLMTVERALEKKRLKDANRRLMVELERVSRRDVLTGLLNRRSLQEALPQEMARARRHEQGLSVALFDLDHFKNINDSYGHQGGDDALRVFARVASTTLREVDVLYRYGGEEFLALLPAADPAGALTAARRVVDALAGTPVVIQGHAVRMTVSVGVASLMGSTVSGEELIASADRALYQAKAKGRNQAVAEVPPPPPPTTRARPRARRQVQVQFRAGR
jgi:diguanylate cyclase (GGDEF)-like protein